MTFSGHRASAVGPSVVITTSAAAIQGSASAGVEITAERLFQLT